MSSSSSLTRTEDWKETSTRSVSSSVDRASNEGCGLDMRATVTSAKNIIKGRMKDVCVL